MIAILALNLHHFYQDRVKAIKKDSCSKWENNLFLHTDGILLMTL